MLLVGFLVVPTIFGQPAKKPRIMIVPSDALLLKMGLLDATEDMGEINFYQHYKLAFFNDEIKAVVAKFGELMRDRGFPITSLEFELKKAQNNPNYVIPRDIDVMLNYEIRQVGPRMVLFAQFDGMDVASSKQIAAASGESSPAIGALPQSLLQEAVIDKLDKFNEQLMTTFEEMAVKGRESALEITSLSVSLDGAIAESIEGWLDSNCVQGAYSIDAQDENSMQVSQAMMPLFNSEGKAVDARVFYQSLIKMLRNKGLSVTFKNRGISRGFITIN